MDLKKRKLFTSKNEDNFFLFCFSFQTRKDLALAKFYNAAVRCFLTNGYNNSTHRIFETNSSFHVK